MTYLSHVCNTRSIREFDALHGDRAVFQVCQIEVPVLIRIPLLDFDLLPLQSPQPRGFPPPLLLRAFWTSRQNARYNEISTHPET